MVNINKGIKLGAFLSFCLFSYTRPYSTDIIKTSEYIRSTIIKLKQQNRQDSLAMSTLTDIDTTFSHLSMRFRLPGEVIPTDYLKSINNDLSALNHAYHDTSTSNVHWLLDFVKRDLRIKNGQPSDIRGLAKVYKNIDVTVKVMRGDRQINGYNITANPEFWENSKPMYTFNKQSSPTTDNMQPGEYVFFASKKGSVSQKKNGTVGSEDAISTSEVTIYIEK